ncbi:hypothetical protein HUG17_5891 [Dermatophagoides farinae]|uniref:Uncharacterized protein n=1 Tax=Dermatophagoides farinae TaxID=6954 RepID=A0A9D4P357_DERFA|nr:uncharacterized protein LOC124493562 [Dermatophagoides farinae]KAH7643529.1 hypothetical protein HUG17_5891 [Dermatophagoides farinae]
MIGISGSMKTFSAKNIIIIGDVINECFKCIKYYLFRLEYSLLDYQQRRIRWTCYRTIEPSIWITTNSMILIAIMFTAIRRPKSIAGLPLSFEDFEEMFDIQRLDIAIVHLLVVFLTLEYLWFELVKKIFRYNFPLNDLFIKYRNYDDNLLEPRLRRYLTLFYRIIDSISTLFYRLTVLTMLSGYALFIIHVGYLYLDGKLNTFQWLLFLQLWTMYLFRLVYLMGQLFLAMKFLLFIVEFGRIQFMKMLQTTKIVFCCNRNKMNFNNSINRRLFWQSFHRQYLTLYLDIWKFDDTIKMVLAAVEMIAKSAIIVGTLFVNSNQLSINLNNTLIILYLGSAFLYPKIIYSHVSSLPSYNRTCSRLIMNWNARTHWQRFCTQQQQQRLLQESSSSSWKKLKRFNAWITLRDVIKSNLFIQTMTNNLFGLNCGQLFFITRYKYLELLLMDVMLILLFYKKICLT